MLPRRPELASFVYFALLFNLKWQMMQTLWPSQLTRHKNSQKSQYLQSHQCKVVEAIGQNSFWFPKQCPHEKYYVFWRAQTDNADLLQFGRFLQVNAAYQYLQSLIINCKSHMKILHHTTYMPIIQKSSIKISQKLNQSSQIRLLHHCRTAAQLKIIHKNKRASAWDVELQRKWENFIVKYQGSLLRASSKNFLSNASLAIKWVFLLASLMRVEVREMMTASFLRKVTMAILQSFMQNCCSSSSQISHLGSWTWKKYWMTDSLTQWVMESLIFFMQRQNLLGVQEAAWGWKLKSLVISFWDLFFLRRKESI